MKLCKICIVFMSLKDIKQHNHRELCQMLWCAKLKAANHFFSNLKGHFHDFAQLLLDPQKAVGRQITLP